MYTLKGIFPEPAKSHKRNFIKENMKQLKFMQGKTAKEPKFTLKTVHPPRLTNPIAKSSTQGQLKSSPSVKSGKLSLNVGKLSSTSSHKKNADMILKKGDMAEFLKRKEKRKMKASETEVEEEEEANSESSERFRDIGCQTLESSLPTKVAESTKLTMLYPKKDEDMEAKMKASGDTARHQSVSSPHRTPCRGGDEPHRDPHELLESERQRSKLNSILEKKDNKDPYLPSGYQKGVLPKYLRERKEQGLKEAEGVASDEAHALCPPGHVTLPDTERKETLRMLRNSFAELVSELNKLPVKTDTLRMRNRKMELEKQLAKLEEGIKVFSRPKVFVKMNE